MKIKFPEQKTPTARQIVHEADIPPGTIKQTHAEAGAKMIFFGLDADLPDGSTPVKAYYATDTDTLYLWDGSAWQSH